jgi:Prasinovirus endonuclease VII
MPYADPNQKKAYDRVRYLADPQSIKDRVKVWKKANPEKVKLRQKIEWQKYYAANSDRLKARAKIYGRENAEQIKLRRKKYEQDNPAHIKALQKRWRLAGAERIKAYRERTKEEARAYRQANQQRRNTLEKKRRESDLIYKLLTQYRKMVHLKLTRRDASKSQKTIKLLGCDIQWLVAWLEVQFQSGMTWENYGPIWHVDHIKPCAAFDLSDPAQQRLCFHWTNLQPLFAEENLRKAAKWENAQAVA